MNYMPNEKTEIYYLYGADMTELLQQVEEQEPVINNTFEDPDICQECGGDIKWEDEDVTSLEIKGACTKCGKEVVLNE